MNKNLTPAVKNFIAKHVAGNTRRGWSKPDYVDLYSMISTVERDPASNPNEWSHEMAELRRQVFEITATKLSNQQIMRVVGRTLRNTAEFDAILERYKLVVRAWRYPYGISRRLFLKPR